MNKKEYYLYSIKTKAYMNRGWVYSCYTIINDLIDPESAKEADVDYPGRLYKDSKGFYTFVDDEAVYINHTGNKPLFTKEDEFTVSPSEVVNLAVKVVSNPVRLLLNQVLIVDSFGSKVEYVGEDFTLGGLEAIIYDNLVDSGKAVKPTDITTDEYLLLTDVNSKYLSNFADVFTIAATPTNITPPPGLKAFKAKLIKKYGDTLSDPIVQTKFEAEVEAYAKEYLKSDPTLKAYLTGKMWDSYKKQYLTYGSATVFDGLTEHRPESLYEGIPTDAHTVTERMNNARYGSYSRAKKTAEGGVVPKYFHGSATQYFIVDKDCGTKRGVSVTIGSDTGRWDGTYAKGTKTRLGDKNIKEGNVVDVRTAMLCEAKGNGICSYCAGDDIAKSDQSIGLLLSNLGATVLSYNLSVFHATSLKAVEVDVLSHIK